MQFTLAQGFSVTTMAATTAAAILLTGAFYYRAFHALTPRQWRTLVALRSAAILLIVLLLFRPVCSYQNVSNERPALVFLLDASASMSIADDAGRTRFEQARGKLEKWQESLQRDYRTLHVAFAQRAQPLEHFEELAALAPSGKATSLVRALESVPKLLPPAEVAAVVLLSDGIHNSAGDPVDAARRLGMTVHCVGVGASLRGNPAFRDIQVTGIDCPDSMMLGNIARVTGSIDAVGLGGRVVQAYLDEDGRQIAQAELTLDDIEGSQPVVFEFRPMTKGRRVYTVRVPPVEGETIVENNQRSAVSTVVQPSLRVLYVEGTLRAEYGAIVDRFLAKDPDLEFCALVQTRPNVFSRRTNMSDLKLAAIPADQATIDRFDVFILGDIDSSYIRLAQQEMLLKRIRAGAGLVMLGGYHSLGPGGYAGTPLGEALPVVLGSRGIGQSTEPLLPTLTPDGVRHPILANIGDFFPTRQGGPKTPGLPSLEGCTRVERARPGATVLAALASDPDAMPVLAVESCGRGRTAVFAADTTRNWQQGQRAAGRDSPFVRFWGQMVRWLAGRTEAVEAAAGIAASTDKAAYEPGESIQISAVVRDKQGQGAVGAQVTAALKGPRTDKSISGGLSQFSSDENGTVPLHPVPGQAGHYAGSIEPRGAGDYDVIVEAQLGQLHLVAESVAVTIGRPNLEFERLDLDEKTLAAVAAATGGRYVHISAADRMIEQLDHAERKKTAFVEQPLYWPPGFWALFVVVLTTEWTLRRKYQLR